MSKPETTGLPVDVLITSSTPTAVAATQAMQVIPVVMLRLADPVGSGLLRSFDRPGGNATGTALALDGVTQRCPDWHHICSFVGPCGIEKDDSLRQLRQYIPVADYVMVGNIFGISGASDAGAQQSAQAGASSKNASSPTECDEWVRFRMSGEWPARLPRRTIRPSISETQDARPHDPTVAPAEGATGD